MKQGSNLQFVLHTLKIRGLFPSLVLIDLFLFRLARKLTNLSAADVISAATIEGHQLEMKILLLSFSEIPDLWVE